MGFSNVHGIPACRPSPARPGSSTAERPPRPRASGWPIGRRSPRGGRAGAVAGDDHRQQCPGVGVSSPRSTGPVVRPASIVRASPLQRRRGPGDGGGLHRRAQRRLDGQRGPASAPRAERNHAAATTGGDRAGQGRRRPGPGQRHPVRPGPGGSRARHREGHPGPARPPRRRARGTAGVVVGRRSWSGGRSRPSEPARQHGDGLSLAKPGPRAGVPAGRCADRRRRRKTPDRRGARPARRDRVDVGIHRAPRAGPETSTTRRSAGAPAQSPRCRAVSAR